jgi:hypothetical protein
MMHLNDGRNKVIALGLALVTTKARPGILFVDEHPIWKLKPSQIHTKDAHRVGGALAFRWPDAEGGGW